MNMVNLLDWLGGWTKSGAGWLHPSRLLFVWQIHDSEWGWAFIGNPTTYPGVWNRSGRAESKRKAMCAAKRAMLGNTLFVDFHHH